MRKLFRIGGIAGNIFAALYALPKAALWVVGKFGDIDFIYTQSKKPTWTAEMIEWINDAPIFWAVIVFVGSTTALVFGLQRSTATKTSSFDFDIKQANSGKDLETYFEYRVASGTDGKRTNFNLYVDPRTKAKLSDQTYTDWRKTYRVTARVSEVSFWNKNEYTRFGHHFKIFKNPELQSYQRVSENIGIDAAHIGDFTIGWLDKQSARPVFYLGSVWPKKKMMSGLRWSRNTSVIMVNILIEAPYTST